MKWKPGPPPDGSYSLFLVALDPDKVRKRFAASGVEYDGDPVCVRWWGDRGRDALRQTRVDPDLVVKHVALTGVDRG